MSLFELKNQLVVDLDLFEKMNKTATQLLDCTEKGQYTQAIVLFSVMGREYGSIVKNATVEEKSDESALLEVLKKADDTEVQYILCKWQGNGIDIPSYKFRKMLCALNSKNSESLMFVMTKNGVSGIKMSETMK